MGMIGSYFKALKVSRYLGLALKYEKNSDPENALKIARNGLEILSSPGMIRDNPAESSVLVGLTILVEQMSNQLNVDGACEKDLCDTYLSIKGLEGTKTYNDYINWLQYIEEKLGYVPPKS